MALVDNLHVSRDGSAKLFSWTSKSLTSESSLSVPHATLCTTGLSEPPSRSCGTMQHEICALLAGVDGVCPKAP